MSDIGSEGYSLRNSAPRIPTLPLAIEMPRPHVFLHEREPVRPAPPSLPRKKDWRLEGEDPDYRFTLANERTFLAWIRTALAILAGGVLLEQFANKLASMTVSAISIGMCAVAMAMSLQSYRRWRANEIAMRHKQSLPTSSAIRMLSIGLVAAGAALIGTFVWTTR
ncbi:YidH family protein [Cupriavidus sp. OTU4054]